jgi:hypothetical protein
VKLVVDRAEERAAPENVGDQALMHGLVIAFSLFRPGMSLSGSGIDRVIGLATADYVLLAVLFVG